MKNLQHFLLIPMLLAASLSATVAAQNNAAEPNRDPAVELKLADRLIDALERENAALRSRLEVEQATTALLKELDETRRSESETLRETVRAKNETIAAKDEAIAAQDKLIADLKTRRTSIWKRIGDIAIGAVAGAILR